jgi:hypothetical protein
MVRGNKEPDSRYDHGEWVILEGEEPTLRNGGGQETGQRRGGLKLLTALAAVIAVLLGVIGFASLTVPVVAQRPWVGMSGREEILEGLVAGHAMKVRVELKNSGRTPALGLSVVARLQIGNPPPAPAPAVSECGQAMAGLPQSVLFPEAVYSRTIATREQVNDDTVAAVLRSDKTIYLSGCAAYDDGIWWWHLRPRLTQFCKMFVPQSAGNFGVLGDFEDCPDGNSAD